MTPKIPHAMNKAKWTVKSCVDKLRYFCAVIRHSEIYLIQNFNIRGVITVVRVLTAHRTNNPLIGVSPETLRKKCSNITRYARYYKLFWCVQIGPPKLLKFGLVELVARSASVIAGSLATPDRHKKEPLL